MNVQKCKYCRWLECCNGVDICGYIAEVYNLKMEVEPETFCHIKKYQKRRITP